MMDIRPATKQDLEVVIEWAEDEGWNPGVDDLNVFYNTEPDGFLVGLVDGEIASSISVIKYANNYSFLGFYIVHPNFRGRGIGLSTWQAGIDRLSDHTIGLDGVLEQQENYLRSGFKFASNNIRYQGIPDIVKTADKHNVDRTIVRAIKPNDIALLNELDQECFGADRAHFLRMWLSDKAPKLRQTMIAITDEKIMGFGTIRKCSEGFKIGPLFAENVEAAELIFLKLVNAVPPLSQITLDISELNEHAFNLVKKYNLEPVFSTARMYRGETPYINWSKVFGITSFELG